MHFQITFADLYLASETSVKKPGSIYNFFGRLFGGINPSQAQITSKPALRETSPEEEKTLSPSNSTELSQLGKVAGFVQGMYFSTITQLYNIFRQRVIPDVRMDVAVNNGSFD